MEMEKLTSEMLNAVTGGADENDIVITIKTLNGDNDEYSVHPKDKIKDLISKYNG